MSAYGKRILLVLGLCGLFIGVSAQDRRLSEAELNGLIIYEPVTRLQAVPTRNVPEQHMNPHGYKTLTDLLDRVAKKETVQAVRIHADILEKGDRKRLAELKDLRVLYLEVDSTTATPVLWQAVGQLKQLQRLIVYQRVAGPNPPLASFSLPVLLQQLTRLEEINLTIRSSEQAQTFITLAGMPGLRKLTLWLSNHPGVLPPAIRQVKQLRSLTLRAVQGQLSVPNTLGELTNLQELDLSFQQMQREADWNFLSNLTGLESLNLANANLRRLPDLRKLKSLKSIDLHSNFNLSIPDEAFAGLEELEKINLSNCQLKHFPRALSHLTGLKQLTISNNPLGELPPEIGSLKQLVTLEASGCQLQKLPESLEELTRLKTLNLAGNQLDTLNFDIGNLSGLVSLSIYNNQLRYLPASIGELTSLDRLDLSNNKLLQLPESIGNLMNLTNLSLGLNKLTRLPASLGKLVRLQYLEITENQLEQLPDEIGKLWQLRSLGLSSNKLNQLPESLGNLDSLQSIDLLGNQFTTVPNSLFRLTNIQSLNVIDNKLTSLPSSVGNLPNLTYLALSGNQLVGLPVEIGKLTKLQTLLLSESPLEVLPETIANCRDLQTILVRNSKLKVLPSRISQLSHLQILDLSGNELTVLPADLGNLTELRSLTLGKTRLLALPESIGRLTKLSTLNIGSLEDVSATQRAGLQQLPDSIVHCKALSNVSLTNQTELDGDDLFRKLSQLPNLRMLSLVHCNLERIPALDWKKWPVYQLNLFQNRLTEVPVEMLEAPNLQYITLSENLLPESLNKNFATKDALRLAFAEAGLLALDKIAKPNRGVATAFVQMAFQKASQRNWAEAFANFEKAIEYASDTMRVVLFAQRADMHTFRKEYAEAVADYSQSIQLADRFTKGVAPDQPMQKLQFDQPAVLALRGRANAKAKLGQIDAAMADIESAIQRYSALKGNPELSGSLLIEQGRYLTLKNKLNEAHASYRKAIEEYKKAPNANTGIKLTLVELYLIVVQPDEARNALQLISKRELTRGNATLEKYLESSVQVLKSEKPDAEVVAEFSRYLASHSDPVLGWSFELFENWLPRSGLPTEKQTALQQLTQLTKERLPKMD